MDTDSIISVLCLVLLVCFSAFFSSSETAITSLSKVRLKSMAKDGNRRASRALRFAEDFDRTLSTLLVGNNIVNILATSVSTVLFTSWLGPSGVGWSTLVMTVVILLFGEITPKSCAKERPEATALLAAPLLSVISTLLTPINWLFLQWRRLLDRMVKKESGPAITEDELKVIVEEIEKEGTLGANESELIQSAIAFDDITVKEILTPRVDVEMLEDTEPPEALLALYRSTGHSRIPLYHESIDDIVGIVHEKDFYPAYLADPELSLASVARKPLWVPESLKISALLAKFQREKTHVAVVVDQYGGMLGIVTMEDVLEELVGEIWDESDQEVASIVPMEADSYLVNGSTNIDELFETLELDYDREAFESTSVGGLVSELAGRLPAAGDEFVYRELGFTVRKVEDRRVTEVEVTRLVPQAVESSAEV